MFNETALLISPVYVALAMKEGLAHARTNWLLSIHCELLMSRPIKAPWLDASALSGAFLFKLYGKGALRKAGKKNAGVALYLDEKKLARGLIILAGSYPDSFARIASGQATGPDGDALLQCALFSMVRH